MGAAPIVSEPAIGTSGLSTEFRVYAASANPRVEHAFVYPTPCTNGC